MNVQIADLRFSKSFGTLRRLGPLVLGMLLRPQCPATYWAIKLLQRGLLDLRNISLGFCSNKTAWDCWYATMSLKSLRKLVLNMVAFQLIAVNPYCVGCKCDVGKCRPNHNHRNLCVIEQTMWTSITYSRYSRVWLWILWMPTTIRAANCQFDRNQAYGSHASTITSTELVIRF